MMTADVWNSYPAGGDELILAVVLADHAADDGTVRIDNPSFIQWKCRMSAERFESVLAAMQANNSLQLIDREKSTYQLVFRR